MGSKVLIASVGLSFLTVAAAVIVGVRLFSAHSSKTVFLPPSAVNPATGAAGNAATKLESHPAIAGSAIDDLTRQLQSTHEDERTAAIKRIVDLSVSDPKSMSEGLTAWLGPLMEAKDYGDIEQLATRAIIARDSDTAIVGAAQQARVLAFMGEGKYPQAVAEAKAYYNVVSLPGTQVAISLLEDALTRNGQGVAARQLRSEQFAAANLPIGQKTGPDASAAPDSRPAEQSSRATVLNSITVDGSGYASSIAQLEKTKNAKGQHSYSRIARGNLLLLSDRPAEAVPCFKQACTMARGAKNIRDAIEGLARAMRAADGNVARANAFITSMQEDPAAQGAELMEKRKGAPTAADFQAAAQKISPAEVEAADVSDTKQ